MKPLPKPNIVPVDFTKPRRQTYEKVDAKYPGLYRDPRTGNFYERPYVHGRQTWRKLQSTTPRYAFLELTDNRSKQALAKIGRATDPYKRSSVMTIAELCERYQEAGCPLKNGHLRAGQMLREEKTHLETLRLWWGRKLHTEITLEDCTDYHQWRIARITRGIGNRQVDKELVTLSNVFRHALRHGRKTGVTSNPIAIERERFQKSSAVKHCRDNQPENGDELHNLAGKLLETKQSAALGWQMLFESMVGHRTHEILQLRMDTAKPYEAGFIQDDLQTVDAQPWARLPELPRHERIGAAPLLFLQSDDGHKGTYPYIQIHRALGQCLWAFHNWHRATFPESPWYFPNWYDETKSANPQGLTHALRRLTQLKKQPLRTSHGMRSYFVNVLRSHGVPDYEIALMIGQKTGGNLIVSTYGKIPTQRLSWMPSAGEPAWSRWILKTPAHTNPHTSLGVETRMHQQPSVLADPNGTTENRG